MRSKFADISYWVALIDPRDQWHEEAVAISKALTRDILLTTDEVLTEVLAFFSAFDSRIRKYVSDFVLELITNSTYVEVVEQSRKSFLAGLLLYDSRPDKSYSLVDCISMQLMRAEGLREVLTSDSHLTQEGFKILFKRTIP